MCGRFRLTSKADKLKQRFALSEAPVDLAPRWNIAPTQPVLVIPNRAQRLLRPARWGLIPHWSKDAAGAAKLINTRAESLAARPAFRDTLVRKRCLIPADGFYEWQKRERGQRQAFHVGAADGGPFAFAGLWDVWQPRGGEPVASCTIITTHPNRTLAGIHDRMPVILPPEAYDVWLDPQPRPVDALCALLVPYPDEGLEVYSVSSYVNSVNNDGPECVAPAPPAA